ncbi:MAG: stage V sporulation protein AD [Lachnospiraceae bacterium]|nr:stage V sporulation protein AD [Lachnospiraceae bacterium]
MNSKIGTQSMRLDCAPQILETASIVGTKEGQGPLGAYFDEIEPDAYFGGQSWEEGESLMQKRTMKLLLKKANLDAKQLDCVFSGDLLGQNIASSFGLMDFFIPFFGLYGACSTIGEAMTLAAITVSSGGADLSCAVSSSHFASAEKTFRYPLEYGNQRPYSATFTVTGCGAILLGNGASPSNEDITPHENTASKISSHSNNSFTADKTKSMRRDAAKSSSNVKKGFARIPALTIGKITDYGLKDSMNMGACMAPAAADTLLAHFKDFGAEPHDYDKIITGDLGAIGQKILIDLLMDEGIDISAVHMDCGIEMFYSDKQDTHAGASGCGCAATTFCSFIAKKLREGIWHRILFLPTGALLSPTSFNQGNSVPGIAHCLVIEGCK